MWLGSHVAVAVAMAIAGGYSSNLTLSLGTSICCGCGPKKTSKTWGGPSQAKGNDLGTSTEEGRVNNACLLDGEENGLKKT